MGSQSVCLCVGVGVADFDATDFVFLLRALVAALLFLDSGQP